MRNFIKKITHPFLKYALKKLEDEKYILKIDSNSDNSKVVYIKLKGKEDDWGIAG
mgnify:CR=1 FL=1